ncbi:RsmB/NOP family class I SAM-dependent RNA methyltransferase [Saccharibacillus sp. CPCC 101409]|uniref:RsmB/NOP family class I SAM-dependent RNA methyltransferase n=1 Tax=Saccharibacillus sp. CPCC 101409 TaxID=3058041 RepID=UPI0026724400|nr:RsmB/NOP family class I SAM-dependent RNA methyltransferase [Saccharibacillus sp. CPCC 101409]MDO3410886.1 RsmB/NOP family class I SAM-dependent RNA methyltransferase [Saccharibacillus sp. CPCC 101409]
MGIQLPPLFESRMQRWLGSEYEDFVASYDRPRHAGIRINTLKIGLEEFQRVSPFGLKPIPWCETGFYVGEDDRPGKHPYYHAGLYYIQEPSAMEPAEALRPEPGDRVLDLCAAPGGKSTQIAAKLRGRGVLVTNDISGERTKALAKNIEMNGVRNAVVLNETPERIAAKFPAYFDKILIDAPCSGEGMFRKDPDAVRQWEKHSVEVCTVMQRDILDTVASMLAPGGRIVYSTCTFSPEENEAMIALFLARHPDFVVGEVPHSPLFAPGRPEWTADLLESGGGLSPLLREPAQGGEPALSRPEALAQTARAARIWPHLAEGEGHFVCVLEHTGTKAARPGSAAGTDPGPIIGAGQEPPAPAAGGRESGGPLRKGRRDDRGAASLRREDKSARPARGRNKDAYIREEASESTVRRACLDFLAAHVTAPLRGTLLISGGYAYACPVEPERLRGLKVRRSGFQLGMVKAGDRFVPSNALAAALSPGESARALNLSSALPEAVSYLKGETLTLGEERIARTQGIDAKGYVLVTIDGYSVGWGKWAAGVLKNEYPAGWRWNG